MECALNSSWPAQQVCEYLQSKLLLNRTNIPAYANAYPATKNATPEPKNPSEIKAFFVRWCPGATVYALPSLWMAVTEQWHLLCFFTKRKWQWLNTVGRSSYIWFNLASLESHISDWICTEHLIDGQAQDFPSKVGQSPLRSDVPESSWPLTSDRENLHREGAADDLTI